MRRRLRASLLWGAVGTLSFLVLVQGYLLVGGRGVGLPATAGVAVAVGAAATAASYAAEGRRGDGA